jgi:hypothetical protein
LGGHKNKNLSQEIDDMFKVSPPLLSKCIKIFTSNKTKIVKRNQHLFYDHNTRIVMIISEENNNNEPKPIGVLLKVEYKNAPIIFDGNYCSVVQTIEYEKYLVQRCVLTDFVYYPNDDNQWVYVGTYNEQTRKVCWKTISF